MTQQGIVDIVKTKLDELTPYNEALVVSGVSYADQTIRYIESLLPECINDLIQVAPANHLPQTILNVDYREVEGQLGDLAFKYKVVDGVLTFELPTDLLRILWVKFPSWKRAVSEINTMDSPIYKTQGNKFTRGTPSRPVVIKFNQGGKQKLQCYTIVGTDTGVTPALQEAGVYVKSLAASEIPTILIDALTWLCAAKVLQIYGKVKESELALLQFKNTLNR